jgi:hypothetical protein
MYKTTKMESDDGGVDVCRWLQESPMEGLLETDIAEGTYNASKGWVKPGNKAGTKAVLAGKKNPFEGLDVGDTSVLNSIKERSSCEKCEGSRMYYCYTCHVALANTTDLIPRVAALPIKVDIVKHAAEVDGKVNCDCA